MEFNPPRDPEMPGPLTPGWRTLVAVLAFYLVALAVATWPAFAHFDSELPSRVDPLAHIWTMRWNKQCLLEGKLPFVCPDIQYPVGAALGTLPPMHFQTLLYVPLSFVFANDVLCYNVIRTFAFLLTGLGTFLLAWNVVRDRLAATLGGLAAMIGAPMMFFSHGELEQITVGWFPIFLIAWLRWVDRPTGRGLAAAAGFYALVAMSAPYFGMFAIFPATLYVLWRMVGAGRSGMVGWLRARIGWFAAFGAISAPVLLVLFSNQVWALMHGFSMARPDWEFAMCRAPLWGYFVPSPSHALGRFSPFRAGTEPVMSSVPSYLGVMSLASIAYAALARVRFPRRGYWWAASGVLLVLSLGAFARVGGAEVSLPAAWLKTHFIGFRMIRVPARFNLFAAVGAAVIASAGLRHLLSKVGKPRRRFAIFAALAALTLFDLRTVPYLTIGVPPIPPCYAQVLAKDPKATFLDVPQFNDGAFQLPSVCTYWQSLHRGKTSAGYTAFANVKYEDQVYRNSPFDAFKLGQPWYLNRPGAATIEFEQGVDFRSYAWLYLTVNDLRYVVVHHQPGAFPEFPVYLGPLEGQLIDAAILNDDRAAVFDRDRLPRPTKTVFLYDEGWGHRVVRQGRLTCMLGRLARVHVYNPTPDRPLTFTLDVTAHKQARTVTLNDGPIELARWTLGPKEGALLASPPFTLAEGLHTLTIQADGEARPSRADIHIEGDFTPFSLWVTGVGLETATPQALAGRRVDRAR